MDISTLAGLNLPQWPTSVNDIHICYLQYAIYLQHIQVLFQSFVYFDCDKSLIIPYSSTNFRSFYNVSDQTRVDFIELAELIILFH